MNLKFKGAINLPRIKNWNRKGRKHGKKYEKLGGEDKYTIEWRTQFLKKRMDSKKKYTTRGVLRYFLRFAIIARKRSNSM